MQISFSRGARKLEAHARFRTSGLLLGSGLRVLGFELMGNRV